MERLHDEMTKKKKLLDNEMIESVSAQIELEKTAESFRTAHQGREDLIEQWEQTIHQMRKRDQDMEKCANVRPIDITRIWTTVLMDLYTC